MKYKAILFDLDGTLLPMDNGVFTKGYFKMLYKKIAHHGIKAEGFGEMIWESVAAMVRNDGSRANQEAFWEKFEELTGISVDIVGDDCIEFYGNEFKEAKIFTSDNPSAVEAVKLAHEKAEKVILSTNPLFPMVGHRTRLGWVNLSLEDFDLVTSYESDCFCKPNPKYFESICERMDLKPSECLLIGNDENEDMYAASSLGIDCFLITDYMVPSEKHPWNGLKGDFSQMLEMLKALD